VSKPRVDRPPIEEIRNANKNGNRVGFFSDDYVRLCDYALQLEANLAASLPEDIAKLVAEAQVWAHDSYARGRQTTASAFRALTAALEAVARERDEIDGEAFNLNGALINCEDAVKKLQAQLDEARMKAERLELAIDTNFPVKALEFETLRADKAEQKLNEVRKALREIEVVFNGAGISEASETMADKMFLIARAALGKGE
jgi:hypothetical protein